MAAIKIAHLDHVEILVKDKEASEAWYKKVLGLKRRYLKEWGQDWLVLGAGSSWILLAEPGQGRKVQRQHFAFQVSMAEYGLARKELEGQGIKLSEEDHGVSRSFYFQDPDGHRLEITAYR